MKLCTDFTSRPPRPFKHANGRYYIRQHVGGKDVWRSLHTSSSKEADTLAYKIWYAQQNEVVKGQVLARPEIPLSEAWESHVSTERYQLLAKSSKDKRAQRWRSFTAWATVKIYLSVDAISSQVAIEYLNSLDAKKAKTWNNVRSDLAAVLPVFAETEQRSITRGDHASDVVRILDDDEIKKILDYLDSPACNMKHAKEWRNAVQIALGTGLRFKCVATLRWQSVKDGVLEVIPAKTARLGKSVLMTLPPRLNAMFDSLPRSSEFVLPHLGAGYNEKTSAKPFQKMIDRLGIHSDDRGRAGFHSLRVVFSTRARRAGIDAKLLGGILGHGSEAQTEHYNKDSIHVDLSTVEACLNV